MNRPLRAFRLNPERSRWEIWTPFFRQWQGAGQVIETKKTGERVALTNDPASCPCTAYPGDECGVLSFEETKDEPIFEVKHARWLERQKERARRLEVLSGD